MASSTNELTPFGKLLAFIGFLAGFSAAWNSSHSFWLALVAGLLIAGIGAFIGNIAWRLLVVTFAIVVAIGTSYVRHEISSAVIREISSPRAAPPPPPSTPTVSAPSPPTRPALPSIKKGRQASGSSTAEARTEYVVGISLFESQADFDLQIKSNKSSVDIYFLDLPRVPLSEIVFFSYSNADRKLWAKRNDNTWHYLGVLIESQIHAEIYRANRVTMTKTKQTSSSVVAEYTHTYDLYHH